MNWTPDLIPDFNVVLLIDLTPDVNLDLVYGFIHGGFHLTDFSSSVKICS